MLTVAFSDEDLTTLCYIDFRPVYDDFSMGMTKGQKIQLLIAHCERTGETGRLLEAVRQARPAQYNRFF